MSRVRAIPASRLRIWGGIDGPGMRSERVSGKCKMPAPLEIPKQRCQNVRRISTDGPVNENATDLAEKQIRAPDDNSCVPIV